jgi:ketosteroid isomerase-like protein
MPTNEEIVLDVIHAVENRDRTMLDRLYHTDIEFRWPPALPYGGTHSGAAVARMSAQFAQIWFPLQPTESERRMDPQIIAADGDNVVVRYTWKGCDTTGKRFETPTLAHYRVRDGRLVRAQMYYYDLTGLLDFLRDAKV